MNGLQQLIGEPLALDQRYMPALLDNIRAEIRGEKDEIDDGPKPVSVVYHDDHGAVIGAETMDHDSPPDKSIIAVVAVTGVLTRHGGWFATGMAEIGRHLRRLDANPAIGHVILDYDSPGGTVAGTPEFSDIIYDIRQGSRTSIISVCDPLMASAACWTGTSAEKVYSIGSGWVGSIGVISTYTEYSRYLENEGIKVNIERTPSAKARFTGTEPMTTEMRETMQIRNQQAYSQFVRAMARNRSVDEQTVKMSFGGGDVMSTEEAVKAGLIDGVASIDEIVSGIVAENRQSGLSRRAAAELAGAELA